LRQPPKAGGFHINSSPEMAVWLLIVTGAETSPGIFAKAVFYNDIRIVRFFQRMVYDFIYNKQFAFFIMSI
jgi:hypothetical protein